MATTALFRSRPFRGPSVRRLMAVALAGVLLVALGGCGQSGETSGSLLAADQTTRDAKGPMKASLSRGMDEEVAGALPGEVFALRFTLRNSQDGPVSMDGIQLAQVEGDLRFDDALADVRSDGLDREARIFEGWPPRRSKVGMDEIGQLSTATIPAGGAIDILVSFELGSGQIGRFSGITVVYSAGGYTYRPTFELAIGLCNGAYTDGEDCAGKSQLDKLVDLDQVLSDRDLPNDVESGN